MGLVEGRTKGTLATGRGALTPAGLAEALQGRRLAVVGIGVQNLPLIEFLCSLGLQVTAFDQRSETQLAARVARLSGLPVRYVTGPGYLDSLPGHDVIFLTPGIKKDLPQLVEARRRGAEFSSEVGLSFAMCRAPIWGVTGSAGKTTTTTLVHELLSTENPTYLGGNIGKPLIKEAAAIPSDARVVFELSSFQLQLLESSPEVAGVLNISLNHLDVHSSMEEYVDAKKNVYRFQGSDGWVVLGAASPETRQMAEECLKAGKRRVAVFGLGIVPPEVEGVAAAPVPEGAAVLAWSTGGALYMSGDAEAAAAAAATPAAHAGAGARAAARSPRYDKGIFICREDELQIPGTHNVVNVLGALSLAAPAGLDPRAVREAIISFKGVEHRLEPVATVNGVLYINDSIATAPDRTMAALDAMAGRGRLIFILGGYDKKLPFDELAAKLVDPRFGVKALILIGATAPKIEVAVLHAAEKAGRGHLPPMYPAGDYEQVVHEAARLAAPGDVVLLSPACASYDRFNNFEERGQLFKELVRKLPNLG